MNTYKRYRMFCNRLFLDNNPIILILNASTGQQKDLTNQMRQMIGPNLNPLIRTNQDLSEVAQDILFRHGSETRPPLICGVEGVFSVEELNERLFDTLHHQYMQEYPENDLELFRLFLSFHLPMLYVVEGDYLNIHEYTFSDSGLTVRHLIRLHLLDEKQIEILNTESPYLVVHNQKEYVIHEEWNPDAVDSLYQETPKERNYDWVLESMNSSRIIPEEEVVIHKYDSILESLSMFGHRAWVPIIREVESPVVELSARSRIGGRLPLIRGEKRLVEDGLPVRNVLQLDLMDSPEEIQELFANEEDLIQIYDTSESEEVSVRFISSHGSVLSPSKEAFPCHEILGWEEVLLFDESFIKNYILAHGLLRPDEIHDFCSKKFPYRPLRFLLEDKTLTYLTDDVSYFFTSEGAFKVFP